MLFHSVDRAFRRFQATGDPKALAFVFDRTVPDLQGLAQHLATPELGAEDLLQSTFLTAIESKQDFDVGQPVLPWLAGILANHARAARRRGRRELDPAKLRSELGIDPSEEAARAELFATLDAAIARLPENYRTVLRLHLQHGLEPAEIARSLERSPGTVRAQLSRGLDRLRRLLPCSLAAPRAFAFLSAPQLAAIRASVLGRCGAPSAVLAGGTLFCGALIMTLNKKLVVIAAISVAALLFIAMRDHPSSRAEQARLESHDTAAVEQPKAVSDLSFGESSDRQALTPLSQSPTSLAATPTTGSLRVHVVTSRGAPVANVGVALKDRGARQNLVAQPEFVPTDADGYVVFEGLLPASYRAEADRAGPGNPAEVAAGQQAEVVLHLIGSDVSGVVVDEQGAPVAEATLWRDGHQCVEGVRVGKTNSRGEFRIEECNGPFLLARKPGFAPSKALPILHDGRGRCELRLVLESEAGEIAGRVVDFDGTPLASVVVVFQLESANSKLVDEQAAQSRPVHVRTGSDGSFRCDEVPRGRVIVAAISSDLERVPTSRIVEVDASPQHLELQLGKGATLEGRITDDGAPVERCTVVVRCLNSETPMSRLFYTLGMRFEQADDDGRYRIKGIIPGEVDVRADLRSTRHEGGSSGFHKRSLEEGQIAAWDFDCGAAQTSPFLIEIEPPRPHGTSGSWQVHVFGGGTSNSAESTSTDASGQARFERLPEGHYTVTVYYNHVPEELIGSVHLPMLKCEFDTSEQHLSLRIPGELLRLQRVHGRLVGSDGKALAVRVLRLQTNVFPEPARLRTTTNGRGEFAFPALPAGRYTIELVDGDEIKSVSEFTVVGDRVEELGDITVGTR